MAKKYRRFIKIDGKLIGSPEFDTKEQASDWYDEQRAKRKDVKRGRRVASSPTFLVYTARWIQRVMQDYDKPTWQGYESNVRLHLLPFLQNELMADITRAQCREVLMNVTRKGFSVNHRKHVQATLSKIFTDAMNETPPIRSDNPVYRMTFGGKRKKTKYIPTTLSSDEEIGDFLKAAKECSDLHFVLACLGLMLAGRKSELIPLTWGDVLWRTNEIRIQARYRQAMKCIDSGTKAGEGTSRDVPVSATLIEVLRAYRQRTPHGKDTDFILAQPNGKHWGPRAFHERFVEIREKAKRTDLTLHSLRHTYGRMFALRSGGNTKALQTILGHTSQTTTAIYSELASTQVRPLAEKMSFEISGTDESNDTKNDTTRRRK